jgi:hypothetical protein
VESRRWFWRFAHLAGLCFLFLPFATLTTCDGKPIETVTGFGFLSRNEGSFLWYPFLLGAALLLLAWAGERAESSRALRGFRSGGRAFLVALAVGIILLFPVLSRAETGKWLYGGYWVVAYLDALVLLVAAALSPADPPVKHALRRPLASQLFFLTMMLLVLGGPLLILILEAHDRTHSSTLLTFVVLGYSIPLAFMFRYLIAGLGRGERWSRIWGIILSGLLVLLSLLLTWAAVADGKPAWAALLIPLALFGILSTFSAAKSTIP